MSRFVSSLAVRWTLYAIGFLGLSLPNSALLAMLLYRYDPGIANPDRLPILVSSAWVGVALCGGRIAGALMQPLVGYFSDRLRSPWGQRRPFLAIATLPLTLSFLLLFMPPTGSSSFLYLVLLLGLFYLAFAIYQVPYLAWLPALAQKPEQRVLLSTAIAVSSLLGTLIGGVSAPWLTDRYSFTEMAVAIGAASFLPLLLPLAVPEDAIIAAQTPFSLWKDLRWSQFNPAFKAYSAGLAAAWIAVTILSVCPTFLAVALLHQSTRFGGVIIAIVLTSAVVGFAIVIPLTRRWGKKQLLQRSMLWSGCGLLVLAALPLVSGTALLPWLTLLALSSLGLAGFFILPNAMLPDVIDQSEATQSNREAIYFGARGLLVELSVGMGALLTGVLLTLGKTAAQPLGVQLALAAAGLFTLISAWAFRQYPIQT
jgi:glycoside/pentoside/hexuronide:cation symporter, GPH family